MERTLSLSETTVLEKHPLLTQSDMLEIIRKQEEIIEQCRISDELHKELDDMKSDVDQKMDLIEYDLRSYRRERGE